ncbi:threonine synthase [Anaerovirgula multivorans]|uniref:Threonine synthase n=1 Tax=Anaerovirgula multivorans TaxID=312168 RepID=A0A239IC82_9FIRM|nr:threonine synthase [Anaerovirgula multivorans]SNS90878.1 threonine synthase [Anaerovirgula multivorans]
METCILKCHECSSTFELDNHSLCTECGGILIVEYDKEYLKRFSLSKHNKFDKMWDYKEVLPPLSHKNIVSNNEGGTPLIESRRGNNKIGVKRLLFKDESRNPTGSFKDRPVSMCISMAKEFNCHTVVVSSSGNGGASTALYASLGEVHNLIFVPETTPPSKVAQAITYGGKVMRVKGNFSKSYDAALQEAQKDKVMNITTTFLNPYGIEGDKVISYEIFVQLGEVPDYIIIPVGAGPILYGIYKGFSELKQMEVIDRIPRLIAVQAEGCAPIASAWIYSSAVKSCLNPTTIASAICDPLIGYEQDGEITVEAIKNSGGYAVTVTDDQIISAGIELAQKEGIYVEPASASAYAGLKKMIEQEAIDKDSTVICLLTGHGLKDSTAYLPNNIDIPLISDPEEYLDESN